MKSKKCINCINFRFSGMSYQMSGGKAGYCFYWMAKTGNRVIVNISNSCGKFESGGGKDSKARISGLREEYAKKSENPSGMKLPIK